MSEKPPKEKAEGDYGPEEDSVTYLEPALWRQLTEAETEEGFCLSWLRLQCRMISDTFSGVVVFGPADTGPFAPVAFWPSGLRERRSLLRGVERVLQERKGAVLRNDVEIELESPEQLRFLVAYPVWVEGQLHGVAALEIAPRSHAQLQSAMRHLQWGVTGLVNWLLRKKAGPDALVRKRLATALDLTAVTLQEGRFQAAATACVTELATRLECDRVSIGFVKEKQIKVRALSHSAQFSKQMNLVRSIATAMDESVDQSTVLVFPPPSERDPHILRAHTELSRRHDSGSICTIPFINNAGEGYGALTLERSGPQPFDTETIELCKAVAAIIGPILEEKRRNDRLIIRKIGESLWLQVRKIIGPGHVAFKLTTGVLLISVVFFGFATGEYRVTAKTTLEGEVQRAVIAPFDGFLHDAAVRAGDIVRAGEVLCRLDDRDLNLERLRWLGQRAQYQLEYHKAMAEGDTATTKILQQQMRQAEAQLDLLDEQLSRAKIVAPFDGLVVTGDLSQSLGAPIERGQVLFEVAPLNDYRVILQVDEREINQIEMGQNGELVLNALPKMPLAFTVKKITPVSMTTEGRTSFRVEAGLAKSSARLRPGMEGFGKVKVDRRKLIWIWTHELLDWARLWLWSWWP